MLMGIYHRLTSLVWREAYWETLYQPRWVRHSTFDLLFMLMSINSNKWLFWNPNSCTMKHIIIIDLILIYQQIEQWCSDAGGNITINYLERGIKEGITRTDDTNPFWIAFKNATDSSWVWNHQANEKTIKNCSFCNHF